MTSRRLHLITCVGVDHDLDLLPHFLGHYLALGLAPGDIKPILNADSPGSPALARATAILEEYGVTDLDTWIAPYTSDTMWARRRERQRVVCAPGDWVISADVDEFHSYPEPLFAFLDRCAAMGVDCVQGVFIDRLAPAGALVRVAPEPALSEQFPLQAEVALAIAGHGTWHDRTGTVKMMAMAGDILPGRGGHRTWQKQPARHLYNYPLNGFPGIERPALRFACPTQVHHYHWTHSLPARLHKRLQTPGVSKAGREYGQKQIDHIGEAGGIDLGRVSLRATGREEDWLATLKRMRREGGWRAGAARVKALLGRPE